MLKFRLSKEDQGIFGGGEEWFVYDMDALADMPAKEIEQIEDTLDYSIGEIAEDMLRKKTKAIRAVMWLARRVAGLEDDWASFYPKVLKAEWADTEDDEVEENPTPANREARRAAARQSKS